MKERLYEMKLSATQELPEKSALRLAGHDLIMQVLDKPVSSYSERMHELGLIMRIMGSRSKGNPMLFGEAGVGKTFLVKCLAQMIVDDRVASWLKNRKIVMISFQDIIAGIGKGSDWPWKDYLHVLKKIINEAIENRIILFMDEIHDIFHYPQSTNILKPHLSDGSLNIIGATTFKEYMRFIEKDKAITRRFQNVIVAEPQGQQLLQILKDEAKILEAHYEVKIPINLIEEAIKHSNDYLLYRYEPDKSIDIIEQACILTSLDQQKFVPLKYIVKVISEMTNLPEELLSSGSDRVAGLNVALNHKVLGQEYAIAKIVDRLLITKNKVQSNRSRPLGVFLFTGPSGVGKTELARAIAEHFTGDKANLVRIDMSIYKSVYSLNSLLGRPPHDSDPAHLPALTLNLRNRPFNVLLLDEIDKADPEVLQIFLQVFDYGKLTDYQGNEVYFNNSVVIMTCNILPENKITIKGFSSEEQAPSSDYEEEAIIAVEKRFLKEFIGRVDEIIVFQPLNDKIMKGFVDQKIKELETAINKSIQVSDEVISKIVEFGFHQEYGARRLNYTVDMIIGKALAELKMNHNWDELKKIKVLLDSDKKVYAEGIEFKYDMN